MAQETARRLRVLMIGAHPDDCEIDTGGVALKYRARGDVVKFVSATNGDAGHHEMGGGPLARRRREETRRVAELADIEYEVLENSDGRLEANLARREQFIRLIREFEPDLLFTHRTNDYHPDHRHTGILVQDASYLIRVPNICPQTPHLTYAPIIVYMQDGFQKPAPFTPEVVVAIDDVMDAKVRLLHCHTSQMYEWLPWVGGYETPGKEAERLAWLQTRFEGRDGVTDAGPIRDALIRRYGSEAGSAVRWAESFEISEYGRSLKPDEVDRYFPR